MDFFSDVLQQRDPNSRMPKKEKDIHSYMKWCIESKRLQEVWHFDQRNWADKEACKKLLSGAKLQTTRYSNVRPKICTLSHFTRSKRVTIANCRRLYLSPMRRDIFLKSNLSYKALHPIALADHFFIWLEDITVVVHGSIKLALIPIEFASEEILDNM